MANIAINDSQKTDQTIRDLYRESGAVLTRGNSQRWGELLGKLAETNAQDVLAASLKHIDWAAEHDPALAMGMFKSWVNVFDAKIGSLNTSLVGNAAIDLLNDFLPEAADMMRVKMKQSPQAPGVK